MLSNNSWLVHKNVLQNHGDKCRKRKGTRGHLQVLKKPGLLGHKRGQAAEST